jgi:phage gp36-like protein
MGHYVDTTDVDRRIPTVRQVQLTSDTGAEVDTSVVDEAIHAAEGEANGYLAMQYVVPVDLVAHPDVEATLRGAVLDIVVYRLHLRRPPVPEDTTRARDNAIAWFRLIAEGKIKLPTDERPQSAASGSAWGGTAANRPEQ